MENQALLRLDNIHKSFGQTEVLKGISLDVQAGEFVTLLGPSGCGKTTTLRIIAGLETATSGRVLVEGKDVSALPPEKRPVNTVFQNYALFPHMNVFKNVAYALTIRRVKKDEIRQRVQRMLELVQLSGFDRRMPSQLSGGQRQRVAIARALVLEPKILLLDEPLGALDLQLRRQMQVELKNLQERLGITFIYITHDQEEALNMSTRIAVMNEGHFEQVGTPEDIYERPVTRFAASFIGQANILQGVVEEKAEGKSRVQLEQGGTIFVNEALEPGTKIAVSVRAERIDYAKEAGYGFQVPGVIEHHSYIGGVLRTTIKLSGGQELLITGANPSSHYPDGCAIQVFWDPDTAAVVERS